MNHNTQRRTSTLFITLAILMFGATLLWLSLSQQWKVPASLIAMLAFFCGYLLTKVSTRSRNQADGYQRRRDRVVSVIGTTLAFGIAFLPIDLKLEPWGLGLVFPFIGILARTLLCLALGTDELRNDVMPKFLKTSPVQQPKK